MRHEIATIHGYGAELVVVGNGTEHFATAFQRDLGLDTPLFVDPTGAAYRALGMKRGVARTLRAAMGAKMARVLWENIRERRLGVVLRWWGHSVPALRPGANGDAWQLGGVLVVLPGGRVAYRYLSTTAGDHPATGEILHALAASRRV